MFAPTYDLQINQGGGVRKILRTKVGVPFGHLAGFVPHELLDHIEGNALLG